MHHSEQLAVALWPFGMRTVNMLAEPAGESTLTPENNGSRYEGRNREGHAANLLGALAIACGDLQRELLDAHGLDAGTGAALMCVHTRAGSNIGEIGQTADLTHSGAVRAASRLEWLGLVRRRHGSDRRTVEVHCTRTGTTLARKLLKGRRRSLESLLEQLTTTEKDRFRVIAAKLLAGLPSDRAAAWRICRFCDHGVCTGEDCPVGSAVP